MRHAINTTIDTITAVFAKRCNGTVKVAIRLTHALRAEAYARDLLLWLGRMTGLGMRRLQPVVIGAVSVRSRRSRRPVELRQSRRPLGRGAQLRQF